MTAFRVRALLAPLVAALTLLYVWCGSSASAGVIGPDVSSYQHPVGYTIDWAGVSSSGASFAFVKATEGAGYTNAYFARDWAALGATGMVRGAYHFARPSTTPGSAEAQARRFVATAGTMQASGDLAPVLDLEVSGGLSPAPLAAWVHTYLSTVAALTGRTPILYTYPYFWASAMAGDRTFSQYPLWIASYSSSAPRPLGGWPAYAFWQYTDSGTISGIPTKVDVSVFNGTTDQLRAMALLPPLSAPSATPTPIPTPTPTPTPTPVPTPKATTPASATAPSPVGAWTGTTAWPGGVRLTGWVVDPAAVTGQASVRVSVDGRPALLQSAAANRPDLAAAHPLWGTRHGIDIALLGLSPGNHQICVTALSLSRATTSLLGCAAWAQKGDPKIGLSVTRSGTRIAAQGWAVDPQEKTPVTIEVRVAGQRLRTVVAAAPSPVPTGLWSAWGPGHGFTISLSSRGKTNVCLTFVNQSYGSSRTVCEVR